MFDSLADLAQGAGEVFQNGTELASDALDPTQLGDVASNAMDTATQSAEGAVGSAQDALNDINPFG